MTVETHDPAPHRGANDWLWYVGVAIAGVVLYLLYGQLIPISEWVAALFPGRTRQPHRRGDCLFRL